MNLMLSESPRGVLLGPNMITIKDEGGSTQTYRIVGPDEIDAEKQWISMDSPVGRSLLSREVGDEITVQRPKGEIIEVRNTPQGS